MCEPATIGAVAGVGSAIAGYQSEVAGVSYRNKAKLKNFERQNVQYLTDAMLDNAQYKQDQIQEDSEQDRIYQGMIIQWRQNDLELDKLVSKREVLWEWVRGHEGNFYNEKAHNLAYKSAMNI